MKRKELEIIIQACTAIASQALAAAHAEDLVSTKNLVSTDGWQQAVATLTVELFREVLRNPKLRTDLLRG